MPVFMASRCAFHGDGRVVLNAGMLSSDTKKGAGAIELRKENQDFPLDQGWKHEILITELSREMLLKMVADAR